jgi:hypothetical protein
MPVSCLKMLRLGPTAAAVMLITLSAADSFAGECEPAVSSQVQADVQSVLRAADQGDVETTLRFTHPKVVQVLGGPDTARQVLQRLLASARESGLHREAVSFPSPPTCISAGARRFVIVPTLTVFSTKTGRIESLNYQLGVKEPEQSGWTYLDGRRANARTVHQFFPEFPRGFSFPSAYRKPI